MLGVIAGNIYEWLIHKYVFHGLGKKKGSYFSSHWYRHHKITRKSEGKDERYDRVFSSLDSDPAHEALQVGFLAAIHTPLFWVVPYFTATLWLWSVLYFFIHRKSHLDPGWAKRWLPWHYDHHMGNNQDSNWCVIIPLMDHVAGTRVHYDREGV
jgi:hypothetical protein